MTEVHYYSDDSQHFMGMAKFRTVGRAKAEATRKCSLYGVYVIKTPNRVIYSGNASQELRDSFE